MEASSSTSAQLAVQEPPRPPPPPRSKRCEQCQETEWKYTCPGCATRTCSLGCSNQHKQETQCSGKRNRVEYVHLNEYSWGRLMQDYSYLEEIHRHLAHPPSSNPPLSLHHHHHNHPKANAPLVHHPSRNSIGKREFLVRKAALEAVRLVLMPDGMSRRKMNMTNYNHKKNCMQWSVEVVFRSDEEEKEALAQAHSNDPSSSSSRPPPPPTTTTTIRHQQTSHLIHQISSDTTIIEIVKRTLNLKKLKMSLEKKRLFLELIGLAEQRGKQKQEKQEKREEDQEEGASKEQEQEQASKDGGKSTVEEEDLIFIMKLERAQRRGPEPTESGSEASTSSERDEAGSEGVRKLAPQETLRSALDGTGVMEWPRIGVMSSVEWKSELEAGRLRACVRPPSSSSSSSSSTVVAHTKTAVLRRRPVDAGWPVKRARPAPLTNSASNAPPTLSPETPMPSTAKPSLSSLLQQYSSSEDEQSE